ncbi:MAG: aspartate--ammonia ligase [archaeon]
MKLTIPKGYRPTLDFFQTEKAIKLVKDTFEKKLAEKLCLQRVSAPRFLKTGTGLQDDLAGTQVPVDFKATYTGDTLEMVHSLAKWKRYALGKYGFKLGTGLYTDMDAIRKDEELSDIHSIYVDQWEWEKVIEKQERTLLFLKQTVKDIYKAILETEETVCEMFPELECALPKEIKFISTQELEDMYPELSSSEREDKITEKHRAIFLISIGSKLKSDKPHDLRAADYDDWTLNGDIIVWDSVRKKALEISSMGIRVDAKALLKQLKLRGQEDRKDLKFHRGILEGKLPLSIGGGIGQSRLCMLLLQKAHIGEVQSSVWPKHVEEEFMEKKIVLL